VPLWLRTVQNERWQCPEWGKQLKIESGKLKIIKAGIFHHEDLEVHEGMTIEN